MPSKRKAPEAAGSASASVSASDKAQKRLLGEQRRLEALAAKRAQHKQRSKANLSRRISVAAVPPPAGSRTRLVFDSSSDDDDGGGDDGDDKPEASKGEGHNDARTNGVGGASQTVAAKVRKNWMGSDSDSDSGASSDNDDDESRDDDSDDDASAVASASARAPKGKVLKGLLGSDGDSESEASDDEDDEEEDESQLARRFRLRPEFEGVAGKRLLDLQRRVADPRFEFDSRFADSLDGDDDSGAGTAPHGGEANATSDGDNNNNNNQKENVGEDVVAENTHSLALLGSLFTGVVNPAAPVNPNESEEAAAAQDAKHLFGKMIKQARFDPTALTSKSSAASGKKKRRQSSTAETTQHSAESTGLDGTGKSLTGADRATTAAAAAGSTVPSSTAALAVVTAEEDDNLQRGEFKVKSGWSQLFNRKDATAVGGTNSGRVVEATTEELERGGKSTTEEHREAYVQANKQDPIMFSFGFDVGDDSAAANSHGDEHTGTGTKTGQSAIVAAFDGEGGTQDAAVAAAEAATAGKYGKKYRDILDYGRSMLDMDSQQLNDQGGDFHAHDEEDQVGVDDDDDADGSQPHGDSSSLSRQQQAKDQVSGALFYNPRLQVQERKGRARWHEELTAEQEAEWQDMRFRLTRDFKRKHKEATRLGVHQRRSYSHLINLKS